MQHLIYVAGLLPAVIFPLATLLQLLAILKKGKVDGVSLSTWVAFGVGNIGAYVYSQKWAELPSICSFLGTAALDVVIVVMVIYYRSNSR